VGRQQESWQQVSRQQGLSVALPFGNLQSQSTFAVQIQTKREITKSLNKILLFHEHQDGTDHSLKKQLHINRKH
jgi:hypothetical protein